jgi:hypothetical protein
LQKALTPPTQQLLPVLQLATRMMQQSLLQQVGEMREQLLQLQQLLEEQEAPQEYPSSPLVEDLAQRPLQRVQQAVDQQQQQLQQEELIRQESTPQKRKQLTTLNLLSVRLLGLQPQLRLLINVLLLQQ